MSGLYHQSPLYNRTNSVPPTLPLEEVDCQGMVSANELSLITRWLTSPFTCSRSTPKKTAAHIDRHCPKLRSLVLVYGHGRRDEDHDLGHQGHARGGREEEVNRGLEGSHLAPLASLQGLQSLQVLTQDNILYCRFIRGCLCRS